MGDERKRAYVDALGSVLEVGRAMLEQGAPSVDVVEKAVILLEDEPLFNAGKGAVFDAEGGHELEASMMDGKTLRCGAVAAVRIIKNPIALARAVMDHTRHIMLCAEGAEAFARSRGFETVDTGYFDTEFRRRQWETMQREDSAALVDAEKGTVGAVARDRRGDLAAATSTGGLTNKLCGRVGDTPILGAGTYADNRTCAVSGTGVGEEFVRHHVAYAVSALMALSGLSLADAALRVVTQTLSPGDGGLIAVGHDGTLALPFNGEGMYRGAADHRGRFELAIWDSV